MAIDTFGIVRDQLLSVFLIKMNLICALGNALAAMDAFLLIAHDLKFRIKIVNHHFCHLRSG